jgi:SAM-dependent methyltransferase
MARDVSPDITSRENYDELYREVEQEAEWLRRGARHKVDSVQHLLERNGIQPRRLLELGCGTGAVIEECRRRAIGREHVAVDFSSAAIGFLRSHSEGIATRVADVTAADFTMEDDFDVVILSHVVEHLAKPKQFLESVARKIKWTYLVIEVPLEDLLVNKIRWAGKNRIDKRAAHVQFFTASSFIRLIRSIPLRLVDQRRYVPVLDLETVRFVCAKDGITGPERILKALTAHFLPTLARPLWSRLYYAHFAVLCSRTV